VSNDRRFAWRFARLVPGKRAWDYGLSDRQSAGARDSTVDSLVVLVCIYVKELLYLAHSRSHFLVFDQEAGL
jgi:hypothetical protein